MRVKAINFGAIEDSCSTLLLSMVTLRPLLSDYELECGGCGAISSVRVSCESSWTNGPHRYCHLKQIKCPNCKQINDLRHLGFPHD